MKLIIDIPEAIYNYVKTENCFLNAFEICETKTSIANGIPLEDIGDYISKHEVLELIMDYDLSMGQVIKGIHNLPSVTPQPKIEHWISVSERLPEEDGEYLLFGKIVEDDTEDIFIGMYDACAEKFGYWEDYYDRNTLGFLDSELIEYNKVIAWMPLPKPYNEESEDKQ